ncbi:hypothetical protein cyc_00414 [Cyclospora cayetanensis]|uniref:Uncharacterized protein n=1 Tax=Cyclospora cayetanensis TaxID=88456 RepID=A0A1D3CTS4_9EIME|nr:hypothetical protein cyc_00414 [Cyclospora cayetanensis]
MPPLLLSAAHTGKHGGYGRAKRVKSLFLCPFFSVSLWTFVLPTASLPELRGLGGGDFSDAFGPSEPFALPKETAVSKIADAFSDTIRGVMNDLKMKNLPADAVPPMPEPDSQKAAEFEVLLCQHRMLLSVAAAAEFKENTKRELESSWNAFFDDFLRRQQRHDEDSAQKEAHEQHEPASMVYSPEAVAAGLPERHAEKGRQRVIKLLQEMEYWKMRLRQQRQVELSQQQPVAAAAEGTSEPPSEEAADDNASSGTNSSRLHALLDAGFSVVIKTPSRYFGSSRHLRTLDDPVPSCHFASARLRYGLANTAPVCWHIEISDHPLRKFFSSSSKAYENLHKKGFVQNLRLYSLVVEDYFAAGLNGLKAEYILCTGPRVQAGVMLSALQGSTIKSVILLASPSLLPLLPCLMKPQMLSYRQWEMREAS